MKQLDILENKVLDGQSFEETSKENNFEVTVFKDININKKDKIKIEVDPERLRPIDADLQVQAEH